MDSGVFRFKTSVDFFQRFPEITSRCKELRDRVSPDELALESLIHVKNVSSLAKLAQARGASLAGLIGDVERYVPTFEYSPNLIKSSVSGHGHASKEGLEKAVKLILGPRELSSDDESDALAVAVCHALHRGDLPGKKQVWRRQSSGRGLSSSLAHLVK